MSNGSVLVVDTRDPAYIRDLQKTYNTEIAESVLDAIEKIEQKRFDAVIINIDLIGLSWLPTVRKLNPETIFIAVSAGRSMRTVVDIMRMGFYDCVFHPFPSGYLATSLNKGIQALSTQRGKAEDLAATVSQEGSFQAASQSMSDGLIVTDHKHRVVFCNHKAAELLGREVPTGLPVSEITGQLAELDAETMELEIETPAGSVSMRSMPVMDCPTSEIGWVSVLTDVTKLRKSGQLTSEAALGCAHEIEPSPAAHERESKVLNSEKYILLNDLDANFKDEISRESGGENIMHCFSCGTCVAACPVRWINEKYNPRRIIRMALLGMREHVLKSEFIWLCSSCYTCHERCPQEVRVTEIMNVLRNIATREGYAHAAYVRQVDSIRSLGRLYEIDDFDNKRRERLGLPKISSDNSEIDQIFEITGINKLNRIAASQ
ncbi:4Fe-4S dicluster domain-containing protein [Candidatus Poribacteria bacterium]